MTDQRTEKAVYFQDREVPLELVDLYYERLGAVDRVLDLGCGTGAFGARSDVEVIGIDIDLGALREASEREEVCRVNLESGQLPFDDGIFDGVIAKDILEHLVNPGETVAEIHRVLKPEGTAVISVPMAKPRVVWQDYTHIRGFTKEAVCTMVRDYDFEVVSITPMGGVPGAGRFDLVRYLPILLRLPGLRRFATSHEVVIKK